jgi:hypothetical protein
MKSKISKGQIKNLPRSVHISVRGAGGGGAYSGPKTHHLISKNWMLIVIGEYTLI